MSTGSNATTMLKDVVAYVDVWSSAKTDNYSSPFIQQLEEMGAKVSKSFNKHVTHVVFKNGHQATWNKAKKTGTKLVSVLWVDRCKDNDEHVDEDLFPAFNDEVSAVPKKRTHRCMQPRDTPERTPENDPRMKKKLEQMMKALPPILPLFTDEESPYIINHEHGIVYSPAWKNSESMAQRLKEMREQRENLSPSDDECEDGSNTSVAAQHGYSPQEEDEEKQHSPDHCEPSSLHEKDSRKPWLSPCSDGPKRRSVINVKHLDIDDLEKVTKQNKKPRRSSVKKDPIKKHISLDYLESPCQEDRPEESKNRQSQLKPDIPVVGKSVKSPTEFKKGKHTNRNTQSPTKTTAYANLEFANFPSFPSPAIFGKANVTQRLSKEPLPKVDPQKAKQARLSIPGLLQSSTASNKSLTLKHPELDDLEKSTKPNKKPRRSSVKKDPIKKHISLESLESPCQEDRPEESKNRQSQLKPDTPAVGKSVKSPTEFKKGKPTNRTAQPPTKSTAYANLEFFNFPSCPSPAIFGKANVTQRLSKEPLPKVDPRKTKQTRISGLFQSSTASEESLTVASASPADIGQMSRFFSLPSETKSLSEQVSSRGKRKQRHSDSTEPESAHAKKRKREGRQGVTDPSHESVGVNSIHSQQGIREPPSPVDSHNMNAIPTRGRRRTLPAMRAGKLATEPVNLQRTSSDPIEPYRSIRVATAKSEQQKNSDGDVLPYPMESEGNEHVAAAGLTDATSEGKENKQAHLVQKMDTYRKTTRTLVMTSMPTDKQSTVTQVVSSLGGFSIVDRVCESTTHVVSGGPKRTLNILLGIARGCWILSFEWILWCLEQRQWIPEEPYELSDYFPAAPICRLQQHLSAGEHQQDLFQGQPLMFISPHCQPPTQVLVELIQLCGGTVCKTVRRAGVCIGTYSGKRPEGSRILSEQWVLDCITHLKQLSYDNYDLE